MISDRAFSMGVILFIVMCILAVVGAIYCGFTTNVSGTGSHVATVYAMEDSGLIFKNWQIWFTYDGQLMPNEDNYSVDPSDLQLIHELQVDMVCHQKIEVDYESTNWYDIRKYGAGNIVTGVKNVTG